MKNRCHSNHNGKLRKTQTKEHKNLQQSHHANNKAQTTTDSMMSFISTPNAKRIVKNRSLNIIRCKTLFFTEPRIQQSKL